MTEVGVVRPPGGVSGQPPASPGAGGEETTSLLPDPSPAAMSGADPLSMLYLFESQDQQLGVATGSRQITSLQTERHEALRQEQEAIQRAIDAEHQHSFWDSLGGAFSEVAKVAAVVASVAAAVATVGAATPVVVLAVAGATLSSASFLDGEFHVLRSLGVDDKAAGWIDVGMSIGGAVCSMGAAAAADGGTISMPPGKPPPIWMEVSRASAVVAGAGHIASGASTIEAGHAQAESDQAEADRILAQARSDHAARLMQMVVDRTQGSDEQSQHVMQTIGATKTIQNETVTTAATAVHG